MFSRARLLPPLVLLAALAVAGCGRATPAGEAGSKTVDDWFAIKVGDRTVRMQLAVRPDEQQKGLMFRRTMGADEGMLFIFDRPQPMGFWMRNTEIPLDIGYLDREGVLKEIYPMYPHDERTVASRSREIQFCLEMNQGWYRQNGVRPGARLDLAAVAAALRARGFKPEALGVH
ncbi:MAG TPA: DUF192 domain-containing protein [Lacunisphaera sp.]|nr:DUF192 domain-containing protein [Lacunisphaera sp.]